ncbi:hypothetical protein AAD018_000925 [Aestuariibius insulae]|uniref:hypothetical protein n=1 Tax=Aestuariibius insulae TaxID=2058287 RepID=UPI00345E6ED1
MAWKIFVHALKMLNGSRDMVLRLAIPLIIVTIATPYVVASATSLSLEQVLETQNDFNSTVRSGAAEGLGVISLAGIVQLIVTLWLAVAWHRYVLLAGNSQTSEGKAPAGRILAYFGWSILIGIVLVVFVGLGVLLAGALPPPLPALVVAATVVFAIAAFYRLSVILPAAAIGQAEGLVATWERTSGTTLTMIFLAALSAIFLFVVALPFAFLAELLPIAVQPFLLAVPNILITLIGISILTTLYGHYVEGRELA